MGKSKIHNINSNLMAIEQSLEMIQKHWKSNPALIDEVIPMAMIRIKELIHTWEELKHEIRNKEE